MNKIEKFAPNRTCRRERVYLAVELGQDKRWVDYSIEAL
jgi:hypothetical protein